MVGSLAAVMASLRQDVDDHKEPKGCGCVERVCAREYKSKPTYGLTKERERMCGRVVCPYTVITRVKHAYTNEGDIIQERGKQYSARTVGQ